MNGNNFNFGAIDDLCVNTLRFLSVDAVEAAGSGHPGMPMGDAPMAYALWTRLLRFDPKDPKWFGRDRFILSAGHGSMLLYSLLHLTGFDMPLDQLEKFRQWGSHTPGHPEYDIERGIETTTGPLGQGFATGVGMAMAQRYLSSFYNRPGYPLFDYNIYAITSDGDMMEGVSNESASIAGHLGLGSIVYLYSDNRITIEGSTDLSFTEDVGKRFNAMNWHVQHVDGNDLPAIARAIEAGKAERTRPSLIVVRTNIGYGSPSKQDTAEVHGAPLGKDEVRRAKEALNWPLSPEFHIPQEAAEEFKKAADRGALLKKDWSALLKGYQQEHPEAAKGLASAMAGKPLEDWEGVLPVFSPSDAPSATRSASGKVLNAVAKKLPHLVGGSADLGPSNNTALNGFDYFTAQGGGRNIHFGVREHAMAAMMNGMAQSMVITPFGGTFLVFSDYMRPAIRLAALMKLNVVYVFTHDSIGLGEDGPTHQPIEHIASLRAIPNLTVIRPADAVETAEAWRYALSREPLSGPVALILTRQNVPVIDRQGRGAKHDLSRGAYIAHDSQAPDVIIMATGSEAHIALNATDELAKRGIKSRVVSMPSWEIFEAQDADYKAQVFPAHVKARLSIEAGATMGWHRYVGSQGVVMGIDRFGASAPYKTLYERFGLTVEAVVERAASLASGKKTAV
ncbi:MAG: transketolase [Deltaproteobacteria bacterium]|nr:transketolase [Deltaproteobacteria bacterium]